MTETESIIDLKNAAEAAESEFMAAFKAKKAAIDAATEALKLATRLRMKYMRALGAAMQDEDESEQS